MGWRGCPARAGRLHDVLDVTVTEEIAKATGLPRGALVEQVVPGSNADSAGIQQGDVITQIGGRAVGPLRRSGHQDMNRTYIVRNRQ